MNTKKTIIKFVISFLFMSFVLGLFLFFVHVIKNKNTHMIKVFNTLHEKQNQSKNVSELKEKLQELEGTQAVISKHLVDKKKPDTFVVFLEELGTTSYTQVDVKSIDISKKDKNTMSVNMSIVGSFSHVMQTIALLENAPYRIDIQSMNMTSKNQTITENGKESTSAFWDASIAFNILISE